MLGCVIIILKENTGRSGKMYEIYDKCSRQMYDAVQQLMRLAEENDSEGFFRLADRQRLGDPAEISIFATSAAAGLAVRDKADILGKFLSDNADNVNTKILIHLAGKLIQKQQCRRSVRCIIKELYHKSMERDHIIMSAVMADDIEMFRLLCVEDKMSPDEAERYYYTGSLLLGGLFKSRRILDYITGCGSGLLKKDTSPITDIGMFVYGPYGPFMMSSPSLPDKDIENDVLIKWLRNIYELYFKNEAPERSWEILTDIAVSTGIIYGRDSTGADRLMSSSSDHHRKLMREIYICQMCGHKINDLTAFIPMFPSCLQYAPEYIDVIAGIAGDKPFITFSSDTGVLDSEFISALAGRLEKKLTVRLVSAFGIRDIKNMQDAALETDLHDPETAAHIESLLKPPVMCDRTYFRQVQEEKRELVKYLIQSGAAAVEQMTETAVRVGNTDILKVLFGYENRKDGHCEEPCRRGKEV